MNAKAKPMLAGKAAIVQNLAKATGVNRIERAAGEASQNRQTLTARLQL